MINFAIPQFKDKPSMTLFAIIGLLILGLLLIFIEILVIPGITVVGVAGLLLMGLGIYFTFDMYGERTGWITLGSTLAVTGVSIYMLLRSGAWRRMANKETVEGKVNVISEDQAKIGDSGTTLTDLRPIGKALINGRKLDVIARTGYIDKNRKVKVSDIETNKIIVTQNS